MFAIAETNKNYPDFKSCFFVTVLYNGYWYIPKLNLEGIANG